MKKEKKLFSLISLIIQITLGIISIVAGYIKKDLILNIISILIMLICVFYNWLITEYGYDKNILFSSWLYKMKAIYMFFIFFVLGIAPIIFQFSLGNIYRFHHIMNNSLTIPLTLTALIKYVSALDDKFGIISKANNDKDKFVLQISPTILQMTLFYIIFFMRSQNHNPAYIKISNFCITADGLNMLFLLIVLFLFLMCLIYIIMFFTKENMIDKYTYKDLFPKWPITGVVLFFIIWGFMAFYKTNTRIEIAYYFSIVFVACAILIISVLLWMKLNTYNGKGVFIYNFILSILLIAYGTVVLYLESIKYSPVIEEGLNGYSTIAIMILIALAMIVFIALFKNKLENKYSADIEKQKQSENQNNMGV